MGFNRILLFGTSKGINQLLSIIPLERVAGIVAPSIRPNEVESIEYIIKKLNRPIRLLIQPAFNSLEYTLFKNTVAALDIDSIVSNAYSMIIRPCILKLCKYNAINIHWSLLPSNRGPNPVQWALIKDEPKTGVTIHYMDDGVDTGDIITASEVAIEENDTWVTLTEKLDEASERLINETFKAILSGKQLERHKQNEIKATVNFRLTPQYPQINFLTMSDRQIYNLIRAQVRPLKGAFVFHENKVLYFNEFIDFETVKLLREKYAG